MSYTIQRQEIVDQFSATRARSEKICQPLSIEDYVPQPITDVSPPKWHLAHTTWFFEQFVLCKFLPDYKEFHPDFAFLFNSYYNEMGERTLRPERGFMSRPPVAEVYQYRKHIDQAMLNFMHRELPEDVLSVIEIGIHHEQQHQELLVYDLKYILGNQPTFPVYGEAFNPGKSTIETNWISCPEGLYTIGADGSSFCYDNELMAHQVFIEPFQIRNSLYPYLRSYSSLILLYLKVLQYVVRGSTLHIFHLR